MARLFPNRCLVCRVKFHSKRNAASYCSNAHRQKAYRDKTFTPHRAPIQDSRNHRRLAKPTKPRRKKGTGTRAPASRNAPPAAHRRPGRAKRTPNKTRSVRTSRKRK